ncbi:MAG: histidinol-phosphatase [Rhodobacteraceae bacterium]|nr:histidinol-phosphatase [Paracoccaceae bacterium]
MPHPDTVTQATLKRVAFALADAAGAAILPHFRTAGLLAENKLESGFDPVTIADRAGEKAMRDILAAERPEDGILGEEFPNTVGTSGLTWVLDPIDGTRGFISGTPTWGILIAVGDADGPQFGIIDQPYTKERFWGGYGQARWTGPGRDAPAVTRPTKSLSEAVLFTTFPEVGTPEDKRGFDRVAQGCKLTRYGMDCYAYALLAAGQIDLVIEAGLNAYDIQAPIAVIQAAGGVVTDWAGNPAHDGGRALAAANPQIHAQALELLQDLN